MKIPDFPFLQNQTIEETIEVLDEMLLLLVIDTETNGVSPKLVHQYLTIRELRDYFKSVNGNLVEFES